MLTALCGCQSPKWLQTWAAPQDGGIQQVSHSEPKSVAGLFKPTRDDAQKLLKQATEYDNANRGNPHDRESLRAARLAYERVLKIQPSNAYAYHRLGTISDREGRFPEAEQNYLAALQLTPNSPEIHSDLGYSYLLQNRLVESEQELRQALELNPHQPRARVNLGIVMARAGQTEQAYDLVRAERGDADARAILAQHGRNSGGPIVPVGMPEGNLEGAPISAPAIARNADANIPPPNAATRSLSDAILQGRSKSQTEKAIAAREAATLNAVGPHSADARLARQSADKRAAWEMNQQMSDIDRDDYRALRANQARQGVWVDPQAIAQNEYAPDQSGYPPQGYDQAQLQQYNNRPQQRAVAQNTQPLYIAPPGSSSARDPNAYYGTTGSLPTQQTGWEPNSWQATPDNRASQQEAWERARQAAVRMGFEAGGGSLFPMDDAGPQQREPDPRMNSRIHQTGYVSPPANLLSNEPYQPPYQMAEGTGENADIRSGPERMAELDLLNDQMRQIQEQISQKRALLQQVNGRPQYDHPPSR